MSLSNPQSDPHKDSSLDEILRAAINFKEAAVDKANEESDGFEPFVEQANQILDEYINEAKAALQSLIDEARQNEIKKIWGHAREYSITDLEMIAHQTDGQVDFIEAVSTDYLEERLAQLTKKEDK